MTCASEKSGMAMIVGQMLCKAWPLWKAFQGNVPEPILKKLEREGDWPHGCAAAAMEQISNDLRLRNRLEANSHSRLSPVDQLLKDLYDRFPFSDRDQFCIETENTLGASGERYYGIRIAVHTAPTVDDVRAWKYTSGRYHIIVERYTFHVNRYGRRWIGKNPQCDSREFFFHTRDAHPPIDFLEFVLERTETKQWTRIV